MVLALLLACGSAVFAQPSQLLPPSPEEYVQLKRAIWFTSRALMIMQACALDRAPAETDMSSACRGGV